MKRSLTILMFIMLLTAIPALAQVAAPETPYDLAMVVSRALAANPTIHASFQAVTTAEARLAQARAGKQPKLQGEAGYLQMAENPSFSVPGMGTLVFGKTDNPWANFSLDWPIYSGGMIENMIAASRQGVASAGQSYARTRQEIAAEAGTAYFQLLAAQQMLLVLQQQVTTLTEALRVANGLYKEGMVAKLDILRPQSELANGQTQLTQAENGVQLAMANLKRLLNLPQESLLSVLPVEYETNRSYLSIPAASEIALAQRPEVKQLQAYLLASKAQQGIARAGKLPQIGLHAQYDMERPSTYPESGNWSVAVVVKQPLYDGGSAKAQSAAANSQLAEVAARQQELQQGIALQVTSAVLNLQSSEKKVYSASTAQATAEEAYHAAEISYANQIVPIIDLLAAQTALTQARTQLTMAKFEQNSALIQYQLALGEVPGAENEE